MQWAQCEHPRRCPVGTALAPACLGGRGRGFVWEEEELMGQATHGGLQGKSVSGRQAGLLKVSPALQSRPPSPHLCLRGASVSCAGGLCSQSPAGVDGGLGPTGGSQCPDCQYPRKGYSNSAYWGPERGLRRHVLNEGHPPKPAETTSPTFGLWGTVGVLAQLRGA